MTWLVKKKFSNWREEIAQIDNHKKYIGQLRVWWEKREIEECESKKREEIKCFPWKKQRMEFQEIKNVLSRYLGYRRLGHRSLYQRLGKSNDTLKKKER